MGDRLALIGEPAAYRAHVLRKEHLGGFDGLLTVALVGVLQHLEVAGAIAVDRDALTARPIRQLVRRADIIDSRGVGEVDRLRNGIIRRFLEGGLHTHVPVRANVVSGHESVLHPIRHLCAFREMPAFGKEADQLFAVEPFFSGDCFELLVDLGKFCPLGGVVLVEVVRTDEGEREDGLNAARTVRDDAQGPRGGNRRARRVAHRAWTFGASRAVDRICPVGEVSAHGGQLLGGAIRFLLDEAHHFTGEVQGLFGAVRDAHIDQHVRPAHDAQADAPDRLRCLLDLGNRVVIHLDDVIEQVNRPPHDLAQVGPINFFRTRSSHSEVTKIDRAEVARIVGIERLFATGVGRFDRAALRHGVRTAVVDAVDEDHAGVAVLPGVFEHRLPDLTGVPLVNGLPGLRIDDVVGGARFDGLHEGVGHGHANVEVLERRHVGLHFDEGVDVRVIDAQDAHVGAAPGAALFDRFGGGIEHLHERDWPARHAHRRLHAVIRGPQTRKREAGAAARLMDDRCVADRLENTINGIRHWEDEASRKLLQFMPGVDQRRGVRQEVQGGHQPVEAFFGGRAVAFGAAEFQLGFREILGHTPEALVRRLDCVALIVALGDPTLHNDLGVLRKRRRFECTRAKTRFFS